MSLFATNLYKVEVQKVKRIVYRPGCGIVYVFICDDLNTCLYRQLRQSHHINAHQFTFLSLSVDATQVN